MRWEKISDWELYFISRGLDWDLRWGLWQWPSGGLSQAPADTTQGPHLQSENFNTLSCCCCHRLRLLAGKKRLNFLNFKISTTELQLEVWGEEGWASVFIFEILNLYFSTALAQPCQCRGPSRTRADYQSSLSAGQAALLLPWCCPGLACPSPRASRNKR